MSRPWLQDRRGSATLVFSTSNWWQKLVHLSLAMRAVGTVVIWGEKWYRPQAHFHHIIVLQKLLRAHTQNNEFVVRNEAHRQDPLTVKPIGADFAGPK